MSKRLIICVACLSWATACWSGWHYSKPKSTAAERVVNFRPSLVDHEFRSMAQNTADMRYKK